LVAPGAYSRKRAITMANYTASYIKALRLSTGAGMTVTVGRLRPDPVFDVKFTLLVHNTVRGAAGAALLNAELLLAQGRLAARTSAR